MALPTSPPISLNQIKAEFGATGSRSLTEFYRGGSFVPNTSQNSGIPTSGSISLLDFLGAVNALPVADLTPVTIRAGTIGAASTASAQYTVTDTQVQSPGNAAVSPNVLPETWRIAGDASDFEVRFTITDRGTTQTAVQGPTGTWMTPTGAATFMRLVASTSSNPGFNITYWATILVEFRNNGVIVGSVPIRLEAIRSV